MQHGTWIAGISWWLSVAGSWADLISWCGPRPGIASWLETSGALRWAESWPRDTGARAAESQVVPHPGQWTVDTLLSALTGPRGILIIRPQPAVGRECLRSQLRNKHVFCKEGQITWLTLLSPQTLHHRPHVTRGYQELPAIRPHHHRCCINSAGFNAKPPLLSLFA